MDAFEQVVSEILWMEGYWVRTSVKVLLTKEEKQQIGRRTAPRWELDIVAYSGRDNLLQVVELMTPLIFNWHITVTGPTVTLPDISCCC